jgi:hypothetical protein
MEKAASLSMRPSLPDSPQFSHSLTPRGILLLGFMPRPSVELAVIDQREFELPADSADICLRKE